MTNEKTIKELQLLDELFLTTENSKYLILKENKIDEIINELEFENLLNLACVTRFEYQGFKQYEKDVIDEEIYEILFNKLEELSEKR